MVSPPNPVVTTSMWRYLPAGVASPGRTQADEARRHRLCFRGRAGITDQGGRFGHCPGSNRDDLNGATCLHELYSRADGNFAGRATVPVLWDNKRKPWSTTNTPRSCVCSIRDSERSRTRASTSIRRRDATTSTRSPSVLPGAQQRRLPDGFSHHMQQAS